MKIEPRLSLLLSSLLVCLTHKVLRQQGTSPLSQSEGWPKKSVTHFHAGSINAHMSGNLTSDLTRARRNDPALLVLARFDEDVKWSFTANLPVLILNRGGAIGSPKDVRVEQKYSNVGREGFSTWSTSSQITTNKTFRELSDFVKQIQFISETPEKYSWMTWSA